MGSLCIVHVGIDLAKNVVAVHGVGEHGKPALVRPAVPRARPHELIAWLPPCMLTMEACSGGHHWAQLFAAQRHSVPLIAPKSVAAYRMSGARGKCDAAEAAAICDAVQRPAVRFVPVKSIDQQARLMVRRARHGYVEVDLDSPLRPDRLRAEVFNDKRQRRAGRTLFRWSGWVRMNARFLGE